jgi:hypothetical protein
VGDCAVLEDAAALAQTNAARVLIKCGQIDAETARLAVQKGVQLLGVEGQSVGDRAVHSILLENEASIFPVTSYIVLIMYSKEGLLCFTLSNKS